MAAEGGAADVRAFLAEAGVAQYADALVAAGYDWMAAAWMAEARMAEARRRWVAGVGAATMAATQTQQQAGAAEGAAPAPPAKQRAGTVGGCSRPPRAHWMLQVRQLQPMRAAPPSPTRAPSAWSAVRPCTLSASDVHVCEQYGSALINPNLEIYTCYTSYF